MAFSFKPTEANTISVAYGVDNILEGYIIQNINTTESTQNLEIADQKGRTAQVIAYDKGKTLTFTVIGPSTLPTGFTPGAAISVADTGAITVSSSGNFIIQSIEKACTYNDTAKWNVTAQGWAHATYSDKTEGEL